MKPPTTTLTHPGDPIVIPAVSPDHIDWECELGVVIGRRCRDVAEADALEYVAGYTVVNDISDRKFTPNPGRKPRERDKFFDWLHGKWHDTFCPIGPCILSADAVADPQALPIQLTVNGQVKQDATTRRDGLPGRRGRSRSSRGSSRSSRATSSPPAPRRASARPPARTSSPATSSAATIDGIGTLENPVEAEDD